MKQRYTVISIHAPRVGSDLGFIVKTAEEAAISIHAPRVGSDLLRSSGALHLRKISIHAPRVGSDESEPVLRQSAENFNPRSPCGERLLALCDTGKPLYFNPRSPCGERLVSGER